MAKKQYKNVYTIMDKVKKGEILGTTSTPRFTMDYKKRAEVIKPYLHYIDNRSLNKSVDQYINNVGNYKDMQSIAERFNKKLVSPGTLPQEVMKIWRDFPKEVVADVYNLLYHKVEKLEFEDRGPHNKFRFQFLEKANNPVTKVITQESNLKSMVFTRHMMQYFLMMMAMMQQQDPQQFQNMMDQLKQQPPSGGQGQGQGQGQAQSAPNDQGQQDQPGQQQPQQQNGQGDQDPGDPNQNQDQGQGQNQNSSNNGSSSNGASKGGDPNQPDTQQKLEDLLNQMMGSSSGQKMMDQALNDAKKTTEMLDEMMTKDEQEEMWEEIGGNGVDMDRTNKNKLQEMEQQLRTLKMNLSGLREKLKNLLDKSVSYFQGREVTTYETLFDTDSLDGLQDYEMLHPCLRNLMLDDIMLKDVKRQGKIDIFIDISGSMSSSCGINNMSKLVFAKALTLKMKEMDMLNEVYTFNDGVKKRSGHLYDILGIGTAGGTNIDGVIRTIEKNSRNAIVLTDAEDSCRLYSDKAYFIGVAGANFSYFSDPCLGQYADRKQLIVFDGHRIHKVDRHGRTIR